MEHLNFDPELFYFTLVHEKNFTAYTLMRLQGAELNKENFFEKVFRPAGEKLDDVLDTLFSNLVGIKQTHANIGLENNRCYETVLAEIQCAYEHFYRKWSDVHFSLCDILLRATVEASDMGMSLYSAFWTLDKPCPVKTLKYGVHIGVLSKIADSYVVNLNTRILMMNDKLLFNVRAQVACAPTIDFNFSAIRQAIM